jgi:purine-binding chemotaxis protein CheW
MSDAPSTAETDNVLTFTVSGERMALPAGDVSEIIRPQVLTRVPHGPPTLLGVTNLRSTVLPVVSMAGLLGRSQSIASPAARVVVVDKGTRVGLLVDEVSSLGKLSDERKLDLEMLLARDFHSFTRRGQGGRAGSSARSGQEPAPATPDSGAVELAFVAFELAGQEYALPLDKVAEVAPLPFDVSEVPRTDEAMVGVTSFRGGLVPVVSLRVLLGLPATGFDPGKARLVLTRIGGVLIGLVADRIKAILRVSPDILDAVPPVLTRAAGEARIEAICRLDGGRRLVSILSPAALFDSETISRFLTEASHGAAAMPKSDGQSGENEKFVIFQLGDEHYGLPVAAVDEVVRCPDHLTRVPRAPSFVEGVMNLRGKVVPVIDQRRRFSVAGDLSLDRCRVIIVELDGFQTGFVVDRVSDVLAVPTADLRSAPELTADETNVFDRIAMTERDGRMILLIDPKALLDRAERDVLASIRLEHERAENP